MPPRALAAALLIALVPIVANAATISVTTPDDASGASILTTCTLRQAILSMNAGTLKGGCANATPEAAFGSDDTITFAASSMSGAVTAGTVTLQDPDDGAATGGTLEISANRLTIDGSEWRDGAYGGVTIARPDGAADSFGILRDTAAAGASLTLKGLIIRNGKAFGGSCDGGAHGGGLCVPSADLSLIASTVSGNSADYAGGAIHAGSGTLTLIDSLVRGNSAYRGGGIHTGSGALTVSGSRIEDNYAWRGGGILSDSATLNLIRSTISGNSARRGGGIFSESGAQTLSDCAISSNWAYYDGGGIYSSTGTLTLSGSTVDGNAARYTGGGLFSDSGTLNLSDSTISGNSTFRTGGGILSRGTLALMHTTVSLNKAGQSGGAIEGSGHGSIERSIVAGNMQASGDDIALTGAWSGRYNLLSATSLELGPLQDNGGPTRTMLPGAGSAAIDAIPVPDCGAAVDQRGVIRPQGTGCDIGAVEVVSDLLFVDGFDRAH